MFTPTKLEPVILGSQKFTSGSIFIGQGVIRIEPVCVILTNDGLLLVKIKYTYLPLMDRSEQNSFLSLT